jgi:hypothetical protein
VGLLDALVCDCVDGLLGVVAVSTEETVENAISRVSDYLRYFQANNLLVLVCRHDELSDWETHLLGEPSGQDIAKVSGRHDHAHLGALNVVRRLGEGKI